MISGVFGLPGAGKTTFLVWLTRRALKGKPLYIGHLGYKRYIGECRRYDRVYTNIPMADTYQLNFEDLGKVSFDNSLIIIDEIGTLCDSRNWKDFDSDLRDFMSLHRHYHCDIVYCSQALDTDKKIRDRTALVFYIEKFGGFTRIRPIKKDWSIRKQITENYNLAPPIASTFICRRLYYSAFDSFAAPPLPDNNASKWSEVMEVQKFIPLHVQLAEKAKSIARLCRAAWLRRVAAISEWREKHGRKRENDLESMDN